MKCFRLIIFLLVATVFTTSCEDMLTPDNERTTANFGKDSLYSYWGILSSVQKIAARNIILGESRGDLIVPGPYATDSISQVANFENPVNGSSALVNLADYYNAVNMCNFYLRNVDTTRVVYNRQLMLKEYAQIQTIRAWLYINMVNNYGAVPFITEPVDATNSKIENTATKIDRSNLLQLLVKNGLENAVAIQKSEGRINYGTYVTGAINLPAELAVFDARVVLADAYLMSATQTSDYEAAATLYFDYFKDNASVLSTMNFDVGVVELTTGAGTTYEHYVSRSRTRFNSYGKSISATLIPLAANSSFGRVDTDVQNVYGFFTTSAQDTKQVNDTTVVTTATISLKPDYKLRQLIPSAAAKQLADAQQLVKSGSVLNTYEIVPDVGDGRFYAAAPLVTTADAGRQRFVGVFSNVGGGFEQSSTFSYHYALNAYRQSQIILRYAEAINRAGFPEHAFAILRSGLSASLMPTVGTYTKVVNDTVITPNATTGVNDTTITTTSTDYYVLVDKTVDNAVTNISISELLRAKDKPYLDFVNNTSVSLPSIHAQGCGRIDRVGADSLYNYATLVAEKAKLENERIKAFGGDTIVLAERALQDTILQSATIEEADPARINLVEDLIVDELALELAFEGFRFYDLTRFAEHKNKDATTPFGGDFGTKWLAWKIARRAVDLKPYETPTLLNETLYNKLLSKSNWYLPVPTYY